MTTQNAESIRAGYGKIGILLFVGLASIGFSRLEDRAIIGAPGALVDAIAALAVADNVDEDADYASAPDDSVAMGNVSRAPTNRIRRVLQERAVPNVASRQILSSPGAQEQGLAGVQPNSQVAPGTIQELASIDAAPPAFASLAPPLGGQGSPVFAASVPNSGPGGGGGGTPGGGGGGVTPPSPTPTPPPVTPIPEPSSWLMIILGLFAVGGALRSRNLRIAARLVMKTN